MTHTFPQFGWEAGSSTRASRGTSPSGSTTQTRALFVESVSNPDGIVADIEAIAAIAHTHGVPLVVDNTLPTPYLCRRCNGGPTSSSTP